MLLGTLQLFLKVPVEALQQIGPLLLAFFDLVQLLFQLRRVLRIEDVGEVLHQQFRHHHPDLGGKEPPAATRGWDLRHILAILDRVMIDA